MPISHALRLGQRTDRSRPLTSARDLRMRADTGMKPQLAKPKPKPVRDLEAKAEAGASEKLEAKAKAEATAYN